MSKENPYRTDTKQVADYKGVHERTIQRHCKEGKIPARHDGRWWILTDWFESLKRRDRGAVGAIQK